MTYADRYRADDPDRRFLQSREWRERIRPMQLSIEPLCRFCKALGTTRIAGQVDHIKRPRGDWHLQRSPENFQSLCAEHHQAKSLWERRVEASGRNEVLVIGYATDGWRIEAPGGTIKPSDLSNAQPMMPLHSHKS